jgi:protein-S-isoprenylcysteine O-methyltransferase Ste14
MKLKKILPPTFLLFAIIIVVLLYYLYPLKLILIYPWYILGILPIIFGISINLIADQIFKSRNTTVKLYEQSSTLITTGVFKFTRNPMYLGFVSILLGITIMMGALTPLFVVPLFALFVDRYCIRIEEKMLEEKFGEEWEDYKAKTRRWI